MNADTEPGGKQSSGKKSAIQYMKDNPFIELPLQAYKTRRNMLLCSALCWFQIIYSNLGGDFKIFGKDISIPDKDINLVLIFITLYFLIYFSAQAWPTINEWRIRSTVTHESSIYQDEKTDIFLGNEYQFDNDLPEGRIKVGQTLAWPKIAERLAVIDAKLNKFQERESIAEAPNFDDVLRALGVINVAKESLAAYDDDCRIYQTSLKRSFWIWEYGGPTLVGITGVISLTVHVWGWILPWIIMPSIVMGSYGIGLILAGETSG
ncbi:MAG: hypothetical protein AB7E51_05900 [Pseudodesulfovibrio sp.]|uniref:hypothetical protein n=1 Tax=Pseudodesulfovibrio sp. TaxID=2035812 RepID=UPI003D0C34FF